MPIDPRIPLGADIGPQVDPYKAFDFALRMRQAKRLEEQDAAEAGYRTQLLQSKQQELADAQREREQKQKATQEFNTTMQRVFESGEPSSEAVQRELVKAGRADLFLQIEPHLRGFDEARKKVKDAKLEAASNVAATIHRLGNTPAALEQAKPFFRAAGWTDEELSPYYQAAEQDPSSIAFMTRTLAGKKIPDDQPERNPTEASLAFQAEGTGPEAEQAGRAFERLNKQKEASEAKTGSREDYLEGYAKDLGKPSAKALTTKEKEAGIKRFEALNDRPSTTIHLASGMTPNQEFLATRQLRNDYNKETSAARTVQQQLALMKSSLDAVKKGSAPAGSQGVLVTFQKILDPTSVVRESEYARSASGLSLLGRLEGSWMKISQGGAGVTAKDLEGFVNLAEQFTKNQTAFAEQSRAQIDEMAKQYGLKPSNITRDVNPTPNEPVAPSPNVVRWGRDAKGNPIKLP